MHSEVLIHLTNRSGMFLSYETMWSLRLRIRDRGEVFIQLEMITLSIVQQMEGWDTSENCIYKTEIESWR